MQAYWCVCTIVGNICLFITTSEDSGGRESLALLYWGSWGEKYGMKAKERPFQQYLEKLVNPNVE